MNYRDDQRTSISVDAVYKHLLNSFAVEESVLCIGGHRDRGGQGVLCGTGEQRRPDNLTLIHGMVIVTWWCLFTRCCLSHTKSYIALLLILYIDQLPNCVLLIQCDGSHNCIIWWLVTVTRWWWLSPSEICISLILSKHLPLVKAREAEPERGLHRGQRRHGQVRLTRDNK